MKIKTIARICVQCQKPFQARAAEVNRGNALFCSISCGSINSNNSRTQVQVTKICQHCSRTFTANYNFAKFCSSICKQNYHSSRRHAAGTKSPVGKQLALLPCAICDWKKASRDIHHIIPVSKGGTDTIDNLITLCPNHHRMAHANLISQEQLTEAANTRTMSSSETAISEVGANAVIKET